MDSIQRLIENIGEYQDLLGFLFENYKTGPTRFQK